jgi:hypothetical protein
VGVERDKNCLGSTTFRVETQSIVVPAHELRGTLSKSYRKPNPPPIWLLFKNFAGFIDPR